MDLSGGPDPDDALGAWALAALDDDEHAEVDAELDRDRARAGAAAVLRGVVAKLAEPLATAPPGGLRARVLGVAIAARPTGASNETALEPVAVYAAEVDRLALVFDGVRWSEWSAGVAAYGWRLDRLARHVLGVERYFAELLGSPDLRVPRAAPDHLLLGEEHDGADPEATAADWAAVAASSVELARRLPATVLERIAVFHGLPMSLGTLFVVRAFELWTHADDVRRALGHPLESPSPEALRTMADRAVQGLPSLLLLAGIDPPPAAVRVVLTGRGGGTWDVDLAAEPGTAPSSKTAPTPRTVLVADVVDYCRLASRRIAPDDLDVHVEGDAELARDLLVAAQAIAV